MKRLSQQQLEEDLKQVESVKATFVTPDLLIGFGFQLKDGRKVFVDAYPKGTIRAYYPRPEPNEE